VLEALYILYIKFYSNTLSIKFLKFNSPCWCFWSWHLILLPCNYFAHKTSMSFLQLDIFLMKSLFYGIFYFCLETNKACYWRLCCLLHDRLILAKMFCCWLFQWNYFRFLFKQRRSGFVFFWGGIQNFCYTCPKTLFSFKINNLHKKFNKKFHSHLQIKSNFLLTLLLTFQFNFSISILQRVAKKGGKQQQQRK